MIRENQIADLLCTAKEQLTYCKIIAAHPRKNGKNDFNPSETADNFYKNVHNMAFQDSLLIVSSLLNDRDRRVISFWRFNDFAAVKNAELKRLTSEFESSPLKQIRDQIFAHQDSGNPNNNYPLSRKRGMVAKELISKLDEILEKAINCFRDYAKEKGSLYADSYFDGSQAKSEIELILSQAKPTLTDDTVI